MLELKQHGSSSINMLETGSTRHNTVDERYGWFRSYANFVLCSVVVINGLCGGRERSP